MIKASNVDYAARRRILSPSDKLVFVLLLLTAFHAEGFIVHNSDINRRLHKKETRSRRLHSTLSPGHNQSSSSTSRHHEETTKKANVVRVTTQASSQQQHPSTPHHIAFICDGNARWARARGIPAELGHAAGAERVWELLRALPPTVTHCTLYAFSTENWQRSPTEIAHIFNVMEQTARHYRTRAPGKLRIVGYLDDPRIPVSLRTLLREVEQETAEEYADKKESFLTLCLAVNYGGRQDIVQAAQKLWATATTEEEITEEALTKCLGTDGIPDPDLIVRTSGETRLSNFLLWNAAYAEIYFTPTLWPDFGTRALQDALDWYAGRKRRFGSREQAEDA